jgi:Na+/phosphate symporter
MNKTKKQLSKMSEHILQERLDCLCDIRMTLKKYIHVISEDENLFKMVNEEIDLSYDVLNERESKRIREQMKSDRLLKRLQEEILSEYNDVTCDIRRGKLIVTTSDSNQDWQIGNRLKDYGDVYQYEELSEDRESDFYQIELTLND